MQIIPPPSPNDLLTRVKVLHQAGKLIEAEILYTKLLAAYPQNIEILNLLGAVCIQQGKLAEALQFLDRAIAVMPGHAEAYNKRGVIFYSVKQYATALENYDNAIVLNQNFVEAYYNRGLALYDLKRYGDSLASYDKAIALNPAYAEAYHNRGNALRQLKGYSEALASFDKAITINPHYAQAYSNRGRLLFQLRQYNDALVSFDKAIALDPHYAEAYWNKGCLKLLLGEYEEGWKLYEWRWQKINKEAARAYDKPLWDGKESLRGKTILIYAEQGLGDTIQFCRYAVLLENLGAKVILEVPGALTGLVSTLKGSFLVIARGLSFAEFDFYCPLMSLPLALKTTLDTIPATIPYLFTEVENLKVWQHRLGEKSKPRIGLVWSGSLAHENDSNRSIPLNLLAPLLEYDVEFHSIQKEVRPEDAAFLAQSKIIVHEEHLHNFIDTASLVSEMDIIISVDTSVAHLAGALGKQLWMLLYFEPDFRWMTERNDSPWYPSAQLFRQSKIDDWSNVIAQVKAKFQGRMA